MKKKEKPEQKNRKTRVQNKLINGHNIVHKPISYMNLHSSYQGKWLAKKFPK